jgi:hypothetical protein
MAVQTSYAELAKAQQLLAVLLAHYKPTTSTHTPASSVHIAIVNGRRLSDGEALNLNEDEYDLVLDTTHSTLKYRRHPEQQSPLDPSDLSGIGPYRIRILAFMIEHFGVPVCTDSVDQFLGDTKKAAEPAAFTKTISILRIALGGGGTRNPYIRSVPAWESSRSNNARAYVLNPQLRHLLIRHKKNLKSHG